MGPLLTTERSTWLRQVPRRSRYWLLYLGLVG